MHQICPGVFIANGNSCRPGNPSLATIHACKHPCHREAVGYQNNLPPSHPNYLHLTEEFDLYLNIIDPDEPLFKVEVFTEALRFSREHAEQRRGLLFHCNRGESRAPSLALLHLAKNLGMIEPSSFESAKADFMKLYHSYRPGRGISTFLSKHWSNIL